MCFTEFYWVLLGFTGFYWVLLGVTGFYWVFTRFYRVLLGFTGFYWVFAGFLLGCYLPRSQAEWLRLGRSLKAGDDVALRSRTRRDVDPIGGNDATF